MSNGTSLISAVARFEARASKDPIEQKSKKRATDTKAKDDRLNTECDESTTTQPTPPPTRTNILSEMAYRNIMTTNQKYNERVHKPAIWCTDTTYFGDKSDLDSFIDTDTLSMLRKTVWKQLPMSTKTQMCLEFVCTDPVLEHDEELRAKLCKDVQHGGTNILSCVHYDKQEQRILKIDYDSCRACEKEHYKVHGTDLSFEDDL